MPGTADKAWLENVLYDNYKDLIYTTVLETVVRVVTFIPESVLHDAIPVVPSGNPEQCEESHPECSEVSVLSQSLQSSNAHLFINY